MSDTCTQWGDIPVLIDTPARPRALVILAHGAGLGMDSPFMGEMATALAAAGLHVVRFEFPYMARRRRGEGKPPPNRMPVLVESWSAMIAAARERTALPIYLAGKSMGGRAASEWLAVHAGAGAGVAGGIAYGYPFHPPARPGALRTAHLVGLQKPLLILQGTRDPFGKPQEVTGYDLGVHTNVVWLDSGDHDYKPLKKSGRTQSQLIAEAASASATFVQTTSR
ncbi:alpha/beta fold hydrolase [Teredinibacter turnerae]|uniref:alpha/beta fold hydrolase n=1 Tax=Teredinibacter turnerae TaxID=2426 RepID=UPI000367A84F|nr:alpha/beta family hydrolase [Teredinibacter turnerae]